MGEPGRIPAPYPVQFQGSKLAKLVLDLAGWRIEFEGFPARQGVIILYPHTSNWDFIVGILAKWALGLQINFWGKDSLFKVPLLGSWMRWVGGVPVNRNAPNGAVGQMIDALGTAKRNDTNFWLGLSPEGHRRWTPGWRSGFYRTALKSDVPLGLVLINYSERKLLVNQFIKLTGDVQADFKYIADYYESACGKWPKNASPVRLIELSRAQDN